MSCILRVSGKSFDVNKLLEVCPIKPVKVWFAGEPKFTGQPNENVNQTSGFGIEISDADLSELSAQIGDAIEFCNSYREILISIMAFPGIDSAVVDFGAEVREPFWRSYSFPAELLRVFGELGISLGLSVYPVYEDRDDESADKSN